MRSYFSFSALIRWAIKSLMQSFSRWLSFCSIVFCVCCIYREFLHLTTTLVFALLPNYTTDRFWYAAFHVNLSIFFFLLSSYAGLHVLAKDTGGKIFWRTLSIVSLTVSVLSYELILPLVFVNLFLFWNPFERLTIQTETRFKVMQCLSYSILSSLGI